MDHIGTITDIYAHNRGDFPDPRIAGGVEVEKEREKSSQRELELFWTEDRDQPVTQSMKEAPHWFYFHDSCRSRTQEKYHLLAENPLSCSWQKKVPSFTEDLANIYVFRVSIAGFLLLEGKPELENCHRWK